MKHNVVKGKRQKASTFSAVYQYNTMQNTMQNSYNHSPILSPAQQSPISIEPLKNFNFTMATTKMGKLFDKEKSPSQFETSLNEKSRSKSPSFSKNQVYLNTNNFQKHVYPQKKQKKEAKKDKYSMSKTQNNSPPSSLVYNDVKR